MRAGRVLLRLPGYSFTVVLTLAVGIGLSCAIFSLIEAVVLRPLPYESSDRLVVLHKSVPARGIEWDFTSAPILRDWRERSHSFSSMAVVLRSEAAVLTWWTPSGPDRVKGARVGGGFFELLGVGPQAGRTFGDGESGLVVVSHSFWRERLGGGSDAVGMKMRLDDRVVTVAGVMPASFQVPDASVQVWLNLADDPRWALWQQEKFRMADAFWGLARLKPGVSLGEARADLADLSGRLATEHSGTDAGLGVRVMPIFDQLVDRRVSRTLWILGGAVLCCAFC